MELENQNSTKKTRKISTSIVMYVAAIIVALIGIVLVVDNIIVFRDEVNQYLTKKIALDTILKQLVPTKLLPSILQPIGIFGGISSILVGIGIINKKISKCLILSAKEEECNSTVEESTLIQDNVNVQNTEISE